MCRVRTEGGEYISLALKCRRLSNALTRLVEEGAPLSETELGILSEVINDLESS